MSEFERVERQIAESQAQEAEGRRFQAGDDPGDGERDAKSRVNAGRDDGDAKIAVLSKRVADLSEQFVRLGELVGRMVGALERLQAATPSRTTSRGSVPREGERRRWVEYAWSVRNDTLGSFLTELVAGARAGETLWTETMVAGLVATAVALDVAANGLTPAEWVMVLDLFGAAWVAGRGASGGSAP